MTRPRSKQLDHICIPSRVFILIREFITIRGFITIRDFILSRDHRERSSNFAQT